MAKIIPVVLSGGTGSRLWPRSRENNPKQLLSFIGEYTMLQATLARLGGDLQAPIVVSNAEYRFVIAEQLQALGFDDADIILEPVGRNTAPAIAVAALQAQKRDPDALILVLPADHIIQNEGALQDAIVAAIASAEEGKLATFGIVPSHAETGYGYIKAGSKAGAAYTVAEFVEKPDAPTAQGYLDAGDYYWNSGMFLFSATKFLSELAQFQPDMHQACQAAFDAQQHDLDFIRLDEAAFAASPSDSIDYAVMEKTADAVVVPLDAGWSDVGSWASLWDVADKDEQGNACSGDVMLESVSDSFVYSDGRLIAAIGLKDVVIVDTDDALLVADKNRSQDVKLIVERLRAEKRCEAINHRKVYRPWGDYQQIDAGTRYQVKRITVKPGESLSLQMHHHRAEHWVIVKGTAQITCGDKELLLSENQSTYIPLGTKHRLSNPGCIPLEMIEVQSGTYLGEDDIIRFEDKFNRV